MTKIYADMLKRYKFRGFSEAKKGWVYGLLIVEETDCFICNAKGKFTVVPESVGQFTGNYDREGVEIYEKDIVRRDFAVPAQRFDPNEHYSGDEMNIGHFIGVVTLRPSDGYVLNNCLKFNEDDEIVDTKSGVKLYPKRAKVVGTYYKNAKLVDESRYKVNQQAMFDKFNK